MLYQENRLILQTFLKCVHKDDSFSAREIKQKVYLIACHILYLCKYFLYLYWEALYKDLLYIMFYCQIWLSHTEIHLYLQAHVLYSKMNYTSVTLLFNWWCIDFIRNVFTSMYCRNMSANRVYSSCWDNILTEKKLFLYVLSSCNSNGCEASIWTSDWKN